MNITKTLLHNKASSGRMPALAQRVPTYCTLQNAIAPVPILRLTAHVGQVTVGDRCATECVMSEKIEGSHQINSGGSQANYKCIPGKKTEPPIGARFGMLVVIGQGEYKGHSAWLCRCDCGQQKSIRASPILASRVVSCGCYGKTKNKTHGRRNSRTYTSWLSMKQRCVDPLHKSYFRYGGSGVVVCERWLHSFEAFLSDMGERPSGTSLDRIDTNGNYCPENCRWSTSKEQARNRSNNRRLIAFGEEKTLAEWSEDKRCATNYDNIFNRLRAGWSDEDAIAKPMIRREQGGKQ